MTDYLFKCTDCGRSYGTLGALHSHIERKHRSPWSLPGNKDDLMKDTEILRVEETEEVGLDDVKVPSLNGFIDYMTGIIGLKS